MPVDYSPPELSMQTRLVEWGNIMLRGSATRDTPALFESDSQRKPQWTGKQREAAADLHSLICALPEVRLTIALQVLYRAGEMSYWDTIPIPRQRRILWEMAREINARSMTACRERRIPAQYIAPADLIRHRDRAVRLLLTAERDAGTAPVLLRSRKAAPAT